MEKLLLILSFVLMCVVGFIAIELIKGSFEIKNQNKKETKEEKIIKTFIRIMKNENLYNCFMNNFNSVEGINLRKKNNFPIDIKDFIIFCYNETLESTRKNFFNICLDKAFLWAITKEKHAFWMDKTFLLSKYDNKILSI